MQVTWITRKFPSIRPWLRRAWYEIEGRRRDNTFLSAPYRPFFFFFLRNCVWDTQNYDHAPLFVFLFRPLFPLHCTWVVSAIPFLPCFELQQTIRVFLKAICMSPFHFFFLLFIFKSSKQFPISNIRLITSVWFLCSVLFRRSPRLWPTQLGSTTGRVPDICISVWQPQSFPHSYIYRRTTGTHKRSCWSVVFFFFFLHGSGEKGKWGPATSGQLHTLFNSPPPLPLFFKVFHAVYRSLFFSFFFLAGDAVSRRSSHLRLPYSHNTHTHTRTLFSFWLFGYFFTPVGGVYSRFF